MALGYVPGGSGAEERRHRTSTSQRPGPLDPLGIVEDNLVNIF